ALSFSPDGKTFATTGGLDRRVRRYDAATGRILGRALEHDQPVVGVIFTPDGKSLLTLTEGDGTQPSQARRWDLSSGRPLSGVIASPTRFTCVSLGPDGRLLLTGSRQSGAQVWDLSTGQPAGSPLWHPRDPGQFGVAFQPDGRG